MTLTAGFSSVEEITSLVNLQHNAPKQPGNEYAGLYHTEKKENDGLNVTLMVGHESQIILCMCSKYNGTDLLVLSIFVCLLANNGCNSLKNVFKCHLNLRKET